MSHHRPTSGPNPVSGQGDLTTDSSNAVHTSETEPSEQSSGEVEKVENGKRITVHIHPVTKQGEQDSNSPYSSGDVQAEKTGNAQTVKGIHKK